QLDLGDDRQLVLHEEVVVAMDAPPDRVFDRQDAVRRRPGVHGRKDFLEAVARNQLGVLIDAPRRRFAERPRFSLIGNLHKVARTLKRAIIWWMMAPVCHVLGLHHPQLALGLNTTMTTAALIGIAGLDIGARLVVKLIILTGL